jgi:MoaA/NifB/PqqE/SkfB family radical SAM enzyme
LSENGGPASLRAKKLRFVQTYLRGGPILATWQLSRCGAADCVACEQSAEVGLEWTSLDEARQIAADLAARGCLIVRLAGGADPFLHPNLPALVETLAARQLPGLVTYGWMVTPERARGVWAAGLVSARVLLYAAEPARHDARVGLPGAHARALKALQVLAAERRRPWQSVSVSLPLGPGATVADVEEVMRLVRPLGVRIGLDVARLTEDVRGPGGLGQQLVELKRRQPGLESSAAYLSRIDEALAGGGRGCQAGRRSFHIDHRGRRQRCGDSDLAQDCSRCWCGDRGEVESLRTWRGLAEALMGWLWR